MDDHLLQSGHFDPDLPPPPPSMLQMTAAGLNSSSNGQHHQHQMSAEAAELAEKSERWEAKYVEARRAYKEAKAKNRAQGKRARQLLTAVACKLEEKERELDQVSSRGVSCRKSRGCEIQEHPILYHWRAWLASIF